MPKIYRAVDESGANDPIASGSFTNIKKDLREYQNTDWVIETYVVKADVPTLCQLVIGKLPEPEFREAVRVNSAGQVRQR